MSISISNFDKLEAEANIEKIREQQKLKEMISDPVKMEEADSVINAFKTQFQARFGVTPVVIYKHDPKYIPKINLKNLEDIVNQYFKKNFPKKYPKIGIRYTKRDKELVTFRHIFYTLAMNVGHTCTLIGGYIGFDHATVLHGRKNINNFLDAGDVFVTEHYYNILDVIHKSILEDGSIKPEQDNKPESESDPSSVLYEVGNTTL